MHLGLTVEIGDWHRFSGRNPVRWSIDRSHRRTTGCGVCASSAPAQQSQAAGRVSSAVRLRPSAHEPLSTGRLAPVRNASPDEAVTSRNCFRKEGARRQWFACRVSGRGGRMIRSR